MSGLSDPPGEPTKRCLDCGEVKALADFSPSPRGIACRSSYCKICMRARSKASYRKRRAAAGYVVREERTVPPGHRWCPDCRRALPLSEFPRNRSDSTGYASYCKDCHNARGRDNRVKNHGSTRNYHLKRRYGITSEDFDRMLAEQGGVCAVCGKVKPEHVDHDHKTGKVRGLLCFNCNQALGNVRDNVTVIYGLARYLNAANRIPCEARFVSPIEVAFEKLHSRPA